MIKPATGILETQDRVLDSVGQVAIVIGASLLVALCARITVPLPFTPVPLTLQNFGVLLVGLALGSRRGFLALVLYLAEGIMGMPVFSPAGPGGIAQLLGPTGGFLLAYPFVAGIAGWIFENTAKTFRPCSHSLSCSRDLFICSRPLLAGHPHAFFRASHTLWPLLVYFCRSDQNNVRRRAGQRLAAFSQGSIMTFLAATSEQSPVPITEGKREITIAHSPDSDDAFMFYGLATNKVRVPGLRFTHTLCDIETLNRKAMEGVYDVTAISFHAYPYIQDHYALLPTGGSVGDGYGPMIVAPRAYSVADIKHKRIAVPGTLTTAYLVLKLFAPGIETDVVPFDQIIPQVLDGRQEAGLIIHEGQLTYDKSGLHRIVDLGKWWQKVTGLPLPLGGNAIRRSLGPELMSSVGSALRESIQYALDHREEALAYAMQFARDLDTQLADRFVGMYVNERTLDYGPDGREAVRRLLDMGHAAGIIPQESRVDFAA